MERLPNEFLGELHRRLNGIIDRIENGGLEYNYAVSALQLVSEGKVQLKPALVPVVDNIIHVDRSVTAYPEWVKEILHLELQGTGPTKYDMSRVEQWLHDGQKDGKWVKGQVIYEYLKEKKMLQSCLGLSDLVAIQDKGILFFRQHFAGKAIFGWKSVVRRRLGHLGVPCLFEDGGGVFLGWRWLEDDWHGLDPALRFAS